jgi:hypothetical protein
MEWFYVPPMKIILKYSCSDRQKVKIFPQPLDCVPGERVFLEQCKEKFNKVEA